MHDIQMIRDHAVKAADEGKGDDACPFNENSVQGQMWLDFYYARVQWLSGETSA
jgi:ribosome modulation factor